MFLYTGHGDLWKNSEWKSLSAEEKAERAKKFTSGEPGFGAAPASTSPSSILTGGDTSANDAQPMGEIEGEAVPCHTELQTRHGIWNIENLDFEPLLADGVTEFLFVWAPLKISRRHRLAGNPVACTKGPTASLEPACGRLFLGSGALEPPFQQREAAYHRSAWYASALYDRGEFDDNQDDRRPWLDLGCGAGHRRWGGLRRQQSGRREVVADRVRAGRPGRRNQLHHARKAHRCGQAGEAGQGDHPGHALLEPHAVGPRAHVCSEHSGRTYPRPAQLAWRHLRHDLHGRAGDREIGQVGTQFDGLGIR